MKYNLKTLTRHLLLLCGTVGFMTMTACRSEEQPVDPPEVEETEDEYTDDHVAPGPAPVPAPPITPSE